MDIRRALKLTEAVLLGYSDIKTIEEIKEKVETLDDTWDSENNRWILNEEYKEICKYVSDKTEDLDLEDEDLIPFLESIEGDIIKALQAKWAVLHKNKYSPVIQHLPDRRMNSVRFKSNGKHIILNTHSWIEVI